MHVIEFLIMLCSKASYVIDILVIAEADNQVEESLLAGSLALLLLFAIIGHSLEFLLHTTLQN